MRKFGKLKDGTYICQLGREEKERLRRREGVRKNRAMSNASLGSILDDIENVYDLPQGSVCVIKPGTRKAYRRDVLISTIRREVEM